METGSIIFLFLAGLAIGNEAEASHSRIVNGENATEGQFPYAVSIQFFGVNNTNMEQDTRGHLCGGALITRSHVVTAASCYFIIQPEGYYQLLSANEIRVFAGSNLLTNDTSPDRIRSVSNITLHPQYIGPPALVHNIGVIALQSPFGENTVTPLTLPSSSFNPADFTTCTVTGWGGDNFNQEGSVQLRFTNKYIYNQQLCTKIHNAMIGTKNILPSMVCAVSLDIQSSNCNGDIGNPLVCGGTFTGILSLSDGCSSSSFPEIYTRISNHTSWLRSVSGSSAIYAPGVFVIIAVFSLMQLLFTRT